MKVSTEKLKKRRRNVSELNKSPLFAGFAHNFKGISVPNYSAWIRFLLFFQPQYRGVDGKFYVTAKRLFGKTYIIAAGEYHYTKNWWRFDRYLKNRLKKGERYGKGKVD